MRLRWLNSQKILKLHYIFYWSQWRWRPRPDLSWTWEVDEKPDDSTCERAFLSERVNIIVIIGKEGSWVKISSKVTSSQRNRQFYRSWWGLNNAADYEVENLEFRSCDPLEYSILLLMGVCSLFWRRLPKSHYLPSIFNKGRISEELHEIFIWKVDNELKFVCWRYHRELLSAHEGSKRAQMHLCLRQHNLTRLACCQLILLINESHRFVSSIEDTCRIWVHKAPKYRNADPPLAKH